MSLVNPIELFRNYLRVRGEYPRPADSPVPLTELPPRARRIPKQSPTETQALRTTSACAENTPAQSVFPYI